MAEGYNVVGFDIERHAYGDARYPAQLVLQDVLTLHGSQFKDAALIVASPPCQAYSYRAMPWKRAKALPPPDNALFEACFLIQREASEAAGHHIPLVVENVCGAQKWVGRARWHYGSFYLWGDVPALMPMTRKAIKGHGGPWFKDADTADGTYGPGNFRHGVDGVKVAIDGVAVKGPTGRMSQSGSKSAARKAASAHIAKIPLPLARHIARVWMPMTSPPGSPHGRMRSEKRQKKRQNFSRAWTGSANADDRIYRADQQANSTEGDARVHDRR